jgi:predicted Zn-dependent peptidase
VLNGIPLLTVDELIARIDAITLDDLAELAGELLEPARMCAAGIGPDEEPFRSALEPVSSSLAAPA